MHPFPTSAVEGTPLPTPTHAPARNAAGLQIPVRLSRTPARHRHARHLPPRSRAPATPSPQQTRPVARRNESASPPGRGPAPERDTFPGETPLGRVGPPRFSPPRPGVAASGRWHETRAGSESVARAPADLALGRPPRLPGVLA